MNKLITDKIDNLLKKNDKIIIAIDGKSTSGKTTLSEKLLKIYDCNIFHIDDFYLPFELRTDKRMNQIGGNIHFERLIDEVINKLKKNDSFEYGVFSCKDGKINNKIKVAPKRINIIEGVYCMHPSIKDIYDLKIYIEIDENKQLTRLKTRSPEKFEQFITKWIPRENVYFDSLNIKELYDLVIDTDSI